MTEFITAFIRSTEQPVCSLLLPSKKIERNRYFRGGGGCTQAIYRDTVIKTKQKEEVD